MSILKILEIILQSSFVTSLNFHVNFPKCGRYLINKKGNFSPFELILIFSMRQMNPKEQNEHLHVHSFGLCSRAVSRTCVLLQL